MAADGHAYERTAIERWLATKSTSPMAGEALEYTGLFSHHMLRRQIRELGRGASRTVGLCFFCGGGFRVERGGLEDEATARAQQRSRRLLESDGDSPPSVRSSPARAFSFFFCRKSQNKNNPVCTSIARA